MSVSRGSFCVTVLWLLVLSAVAVPAQAASSGERVTLRSEDFFALLDWPNPTESSTCHSTTSCGPEYGSCAGWSSPYSCSDPFCGEHQQCDFCPNPPCGYGPAMLQWTEYYRVCFNQAGEPCTEYAHAIINTGCGCW